MERRVIGLGLGLAFIVSGLVGACASNWSANGAATADAQPPVEEPTEAAQSAQAASELREHYRHHNSGGLTQFIALSLDTLGGSDEKHPQIEELQYQLNKCLAPARAVERNLLLILADGIAIGSIDTPKANTDIGQLSATANGAQDCSADVLNQLHALLTPAEREALVDKVEAHWQVWRQVNEGPEAGWRERGGRIAEVTAELNLTPNQQEQLSSALRAAQDNQRDDFDPQAADARVQAFAPDFMGESFDGKAVTANENGRIATHGARRMVTFVEALVPLLTPDQRQLLSAHYREHASHHPEIPAPNHQPDIHPVSVK